MLLLEAMLPAQLTVGTAKAMQHLDLLAPQPPATTMSSSQRLSQLLLTQ
mgnify:CR=1 FL=1